MAVVNSFLTRLKKIVGSKDKMDYQSLKTIHKLLGEIEDLGSQVDVKQSNEGLQLIEMLENLKYDVLLKQVNGKTAILSDDLVEAAKVLDRNKDGIITREELEYSLKALDSDGDQTITEAEVAQFLASHP